MHTPRLLQIKAAVLPLHRKLTTGIKKVIYPKKLAHPSDPLDKTWVRDESKPPVVHISPPQSWLRRQQLVRVTLAEHQWLCEHKPGIARYTRCFEYPPSEFITNSGTLTPARPTIVREFWVGSRSMAVGQDSSAMSLDAMDDQMGDDTPAGFRKSQADQEEAAEITELMTLLYDDPPAYEAWCKAEAERRLMEAITRKPRLRKHAHILRLYHLDCVKSEHPHSCMIEDEWGQTRPVRIGDCITIVRGSNDNLDALFLEEADDPREQNDFGAAGCDHRYSDRFRANTELEENMLHSSCRTSGSYQHIIPNSAMPEGTRWMMDDETMRKAASIMAHKHIRANPALYDSWSKGQCSCLLALTDGFESQLRRQCADLRFDREGNLESGYFMSRHEFFADLETPHLRRNRSSLAKGERRCNITLSGTGRKQTGFKPPKESPRPVDWNEVRGSMTTVPYST